MVERALSARVEAAGLDWIVPDWPAPARICALSTTRNGREGAAFDVARDQAPFASAREELMRWLPAEPVWLTQVHGTPIADAAVARVAGVVCVVRSADCLPVLMCDRHGRVVAAAHAGWRGLAAG